MMYCEKCGNPIGKADSFCHKCGNPAAKAGRPDKKKRKVTAIAVWVLVILCSAVPMGNFWRKTVFSPAKYYQYIEKKEMKETAQTAAALYQNIIKNNINLADKSADGELEIKLSDTARGYLGWISPVPTYWMDDMKLNVNTAVKDHVIGGNLEFSLGKDRIFSADAVVDLDEETVYTRIPELSRTYLGLESDEMQKALRGIGIYPDETKALLDMVEGIYENMPDKKLVKKLLYDYVSRALKCIDKVKKSEKTVWVEGISVDCTELVATIDVETKREIAEVILKKAQKDKSLKKIICDMGNVSWDFLFGSEAYSPDGKELYEAFMEEVEYGLAHLDEIEKSTKSITMTLYVNGRGEVIGREFACDDRKASWTMPGKGKNFGCRFSFENGDTAVSLNGFGEKSGSRLNGEFELVYNYERAAMLEVKNFDTDAAKNGYLGGSFTLYPERQLGRMIRPLRRIDGYLEDYRMQIDVESGKDGMDLCIDVVEERDETVLGTITAAVKTSGGKKTGMPSKGKRYEAEDISDAEEWMENQNWKNFFDKMEDTVLDGPFLEMMEEEILWR